MAEDYSVRTIRDLEDLFHSQKIFRPIRLQRYEQGTELVYDVKEVAGTKKGRIRALVEKFVGGGFAGQVYRVKMLDIDAPDGPIGGLEVGEAYAVKILIPPSKFSRLFRNVLYLVGFQGPFQLQVNPMAARAGVQTLLAARKSVPKSLSSGTAV